jgi:hypothetical protein
MLSCAGKGHRATLPERRAVVNLRTGVIINVRRAYLRPVVSVGAHSLQSTRPSD